MHILHAFFRAMLLSSLREAFSELYC